MTDTSTNHHGNPDELAEPDLGPLPDVVKVNAATAARLPSQRVLDMLARIEPTPIGELMTNSTSRVLAFRVLLRDHPARDPASLWAASYDIEVEFEDVDPTSAAAPPTWPPSAPTTA
jgi:hypothetical protein